MEPTALGVSAQAPQPTRLRIALGRDATRGFVDVTATVRVQTGDKSIWKQVFTIDPAESAPLTVPCPQGFFRIDAVLGDGRQAHAEGVADAGTTDVRLEVDPVPANVEPVRSHLQSTGGSGATLRDVMGPAGRMRFWSQRGGRWQPSPLSVTPREKGRRRLVVAVPPLADPARHVFVEVGGSAMDTSAVAVVPCAWVGDASPVATEVVVDLGDAGASTPALRVRPVLPEGDLRDLSRLLVQSDLSVVDEVSPSLARKAETLFGRDEADCVLGTAGALVLLRVRRLDLMHDWTRQLADNYPDLPDASVIRAWHLLFAQADAGELAVGPGETPLADLMRAADSGVPIFTESLRLLVQGLRLFRASDAAAAGELERVEDYFWAADPREVFTTFDNLGPSVVSTRIGPASTLWTYRWANEV